MVWAILHLSIWYALFYLWIEYLSNTNQYCTKYKSLLIQYLAFQIEIIWYSTFLKIEYLTQHLYHQIEYKIVQYLLDQIEISRMKAPWIRYKIAQDKTFRYNALLTHRDLLLIRYIFIRQTVHLTNNRYRDVWTRICVTFLWGPN